MVCVYKLATDTEGVPTQTLPVDNLVHRAFNNLNLGLKWAHHQIGERKRIGAKNGT